MANVNDSVVHRVAMLPSQLDRRVFADNVFKLLCDRYNNSYDELNGLTIDVRRVESIVDTIVSPSDSKIWLTVRFERTAFKPTVGGRLGGEGCTVTGVFPEGVFIDHGIFSSLLIGGTTATKTTACSFSGCDCVFRVGDVATNLEIIEWEYKLNSPRRLYCIVRHVH